MTDWSATAQNALRMIRAKGQAVTFNRDGLIWAGSAVELSASGDDQSHISDTMVMQKKRNLLIGAAGLDRAPEVGDAVLLGENEWKITAVDPVKPGVTPLIFKGEIVQ